MPIVKAIGKTLLFVAVLYAFFRYAGNFPSNQSVALTAVAWLGYGLYEKLNISRKTEEVFTPFCVSFYPNWHQLLSDFTLIRGEDSWNLLCDAAAEVPAAKFSIFRQGFSVTVIRPPSSNSPPPGLLFWNNEKLFLNDLDLEAAIIEPEDDRLRGFEHKHKFFDHPSWSSLPRVVFKCGGEGYEMGLVVQMEWWEERCQSGEVKELAKLNQRKDHMCGTTRLTVATLPYSEFAGYYRDIEYGELTKLQEECDKQLAARGWKRKVERDSEIRDPWSRVEHKYFSVAHRSI